MVTWNSDCITTLIIRGDSFVVECIYYKTYCATGLILMHPVLQGLTPVEEMLVSAVMPIMSIYRLPHGQYGYSGHVINLPQDVASFATSLPRLPSELDVIVVIYTVLFS